MSLSPTQRRTHITRFLTEMAAAIGDNHVYDRVAVRPSEDFPWMPRSIWNDLQDHYLINQAYRAPGYFTLTELGYERALKLTGEWNSEEMRERCKRLARSIKRQVDGRHDDVTVEVDLIATDAQLPVNWVRSALQVRLLAQILGDRSYIMSLDVDSNFVEVPANFGHASIELEKLD